MNSVLTVYKGIVRSRILAVITRYWITESVVAHWYSDHALYLCLGGFTGQDQPLYVIGMPAGSHEQSCSGWSGPSEL